MQNQPEHATSRTYGRFDFDPEFPVIAFDHVQEDRIIRALHAHNGLEIGYCYSGTGIFMVEDKVLQFSAGDVSVINQKEMHLARSAVGTVSEWTFVTLDPVQLLYAFPIDAPYVQADDLFGTDFNNIIKPQENAQPGKLLQRIIEEIKNKEDGYQTCIRGLVQAFLVEVHRIRRSAEGHTAQMDHRASERLGPALNMIASAYTESLTMEQLASSCFMSITNFRRVFKAGLGIAPQEYLTRFRIHMAMGLLESRDQAIIDIALDVGYQTLSSFNRNFKRITGMAPREWRKAYGK